MCPLKKWQVNLIQETVNERSINITCIICNRKQLRTMHNNKYRDRANKENNSLSPRVKGKKQNSKILLPYTTAY